MFSPHCFALWALVWRWAVWRCSGVATLAGVVRVTFTTYPLPLPGPTLTHVPTDPTTCLQLHSFSVDHMSLNKFYWLITQLIFHSDFVNKETSFEHLGAVIVALVRSRFHFHLLPSLSLSVGSPGANLLNSGLYGVIWRYMLYLIWLHMALYGCGT